MEQVAVVVYGDGCPGRQSGKTAAGSQTTRLLVADRGTASPRRRHAKAKYDVSSVARDGVVNGTYDLTAPSARLPAARADQLSCSRCC